MGSNRSGFKTLFSKKKSIYTLWRDALTRGSLLAKLTVEFIIVQPPLLDLPTQGKQFLGDIPRSGMARI